MPKFMVNKILGRIMAGTLVVLSVIVGYRYICIMADAPSGLGYVTFPVAIISGLFCAVSIYLISNSEEP